MKRFFAAVFSILFSSLLYARINVGVLRGMCAIPFANMMENSDCNFVFFDSAEEMLREMKAGNIDAANISSTGAEKLVNKAEDAVRVTAITSTTDFVIVGNGTGKITFDYLLGRRIAVAGNGLSARMFNYILSENQIPSGTTEGGVEIIYYKNQQQAIEGFMKDQVSYIITSQPATAALCAHSKKVNELMDLQEQYQFLSGTGHPVPLTVLVARIQFLEENYEKFQEFSAELEESILKIKINITRTSRNAVKYEMGINPGIIQSALENSRFTYIPYAGKFHLIVNQ